MSTIARRSAERGTHNPDLVNRSKALNQAEATSGLALRGLGHGVGEVVQVSAHGVEEAAHR
jgi:phosphotransferase system HPr-like phosphotransfer protein